MKYKINGNHDAPGTKAERPPNYPDIDPEAMEKFDRVAEPDSHDETEDDKWLLHPNDAASESECAALEDDWEPNFAPSSPPYGASRSDRRERAGMSYDRRMKLHKRYPVIAKIAAPGVTLKITFGKEVEEIPIADLMTCHLLREDFDIVALHHDEQIILHDRPTIWKWNVIPQKTGVRKLSLVVSRKIKKGQNTGYHDEPVLDRYASINVDPIHETGRFMAKNWQWIAGTVAGSGVLWHFLTKGK